MDKKYTIRQVARLTGLSASNIRYYEKERLIENIGRTPAGVRMFSQRDVEWIRFLARLKDMEMPVAMMKSYAVLRAQGNVTIRERIALLNAHKEHMGRKIEHIRDHIALLDEKIGFYQEMEKKTNEKRTL